MVKIGATFTKFQRVVHDVARELGKDITLEISGEDTELDKTVVEKIGDPLLHLVRNAIDHGVEPAEQRLAKGKPARGKVRLNAFHESGSIVIEVGDDGGGLKRERILARRWSAGWSSPAALSDGEGFRPDLRARLLDRRADHQPVGGAALAWMLSSATSQRCVAASIASREGEGTTVSVRLPSPWPSSTASRSRSGSRSS